MRTATISIDRQYAKEFEYIIGELGRIDLTFQVLEGRKRHFLELNAAHDLSSEVFRLVADVILVYFKSRYIKDKLVKSRGKISDAMALLISSLVYFDVGIETEILSGILKDEGEYAIDGLFHFKLSELTENWDELCSLSLSLLSLNPKESDLLSLTAFLIDASNCKKNKILVHEGEVLNMTTNESIFVHDIFSDERQNLIGAVIGGFPEEVLLGAGEERTLMKPLERIVPTAKSDAQ